MPELKAKRLWPMRGFRGRGDEEMGGEANLGMGGQGMGKRGEKLNGRERRDIGSHQRSNHTSERMVNVSDPPM